MSNPKDISFYANAFTKLRRDYKKGGAPHKPILLISVLQAFEEKLITDNKIYIIPELVGLFKSNWNEYVITDHDVRFALPFYHLSNEKANFWRLTPNLGYEKMIESKSAMRSFKALKLAVKYAEIDSELFHLMLDKPQNKILKEIIIDKYFPHKKNDKSPLSTNYNQQISKDILEDSVVEYVKKIKQLQIELSKEQYEEERFLRSGRFKREVLLKYNNTCCICGLRIDTTANISMLDACHIIPFAESYDDTISNGLALTPTLHRAFDRGLIALDHDYRILVGKHFIEKNHSSYGIKQFENKQIFLPDNLIKLPSLEKLRHHRERFGF